MVDWWPLRIYRPSWSAYYNYNSSRRCCCKEDKNNHLFWDRIKSSKINEDFPVGGKQTLHNGWSSGLLCFTPLTKLMGSSLHDTKTDGSSASHSHWNLYPKTPPLNPLFLWKVLLFIAFARETWRNNSFMSSSELYCQNHFNRAEHPSRWSAECDCQSTWFIEVLRVVIPSLNQLLKRQRSWNLRWLKLNAICHFEFGLHFTD